MYNDSSVISVICCLFPSPDRDHKCHIIKKQKDHDKAFTETMSCSFVISLITPSIEWERAPKGQTNLEVYDAFTPIVMSRCKQAAKFIHSKHVEFDENKLSHINITFEVNHSSISFKYSVD